MRRRSRRGSASRRTAPFDVDRVPEVANAQRQPTWRRRTSIARRCSSTRSSCRKAEFDSSRRRPRRRAGNTTSPATRPNSSTRRCSPRARAWPSRARRSPTPWCARRLPVSSRERLVSVGDYVTRGTKVASVMRINPLRVELTVPGQYISAVARGRSVALEVDAYPGQDVHGAGALRVAGAEADSRALIVEAVVANANGRVEARPLRHRTDRAGARARLRSSSPRAAVRTVSGTARVFVVTHGTAARSASSPPARRSTTRRDHQRPQGAARRRRDQQRRRSLPTACASPRRGRSAMQWLAALCVRRPVFASVLILSLTVVGAVRLHPAWRRPVAERRLSRRSGDDAPARRRAGAGRERGHRQDRGGRQHHQRHRSAQLDFGRRHLAGRRRLPAREERRRRRAGSARRVNRILPLLPRTITQPTVEKRDPDASPILTVAVTANKPLRDITEYADKVLRRQLESADGVGQVLVLRRPQASDQRLARLRERLRATT